MATEAERMAFRGLLALLDAVLAWAEAGATLPEGRAAAIRKAAEDCRQVLLPPAAADDAPPVVH